MHPLRASYAGVITIINRANGQFVQQAGSRGTDFVLKIEDLSELFIQADANDVDVVKLHTGQLASIKISAVPNKIFSGVVAEVALSSKTEQTQWGNQKIVYPLKVLFTDQDNALRPGMNALVDVTTAKKDQVIVIPIEFLHQAGEETYVLLKNHIKRVVTIGLLTPLFVEIVNGLTVGEEIERVNYFVD